MSILQVRHCLACGEKTYHRYENKLRCNFLPRDGWMCVACENNTRIRYRKTQEASLAMEPVTAEAV